MFVYIIIYNLLYIYPMLLLSMSIVKCMLSVFVPHRIRLEKINVGVGIAVFLHAKVQTFLLVDPFKNKLSRYLIVAFGADNEYAWSVR